jgi:hypothetical protein
VNGGTWLRCFYDFFGKGDFDGLRYDLVASLLVATEQPLLLGKEICRHLLTFALDEVRASNCTEKIQQGLAIVRRNHERRLKGPALRLNGTANGPKVVELSLAPASPVGVRLHRIWRQLFLR